jgi:hypothetical protein
METGAISIGIHLVKPRSESSNETHCEPCKVDDEKDSVAVRRSWAEEYRDRRRAPRASGLYQKA